MLPYATRFHDPRTDRHAGAPALRRAPHMRLYRANLARKHAALFQAMRLDKRFALVTLGRALDAYAAPYASVSFNTRACTMANASEQFARDNAIPGMLYQWAGAHRALSDRTKIACYPTMADMQRGREVVMSAGRFFAACFPDETPAQIQQRAENFNLDASAVKFATTPDEWAEVYTTARGFRSCMTGFRDDDDHPVRFYAHPGNGLRLAYLATDGDTTARCIVNDDTKAYVKVYGDARLGDMLETLGYSHDADEALDGVTCNARTHSDNGCLIAPYLDAIQSVSWDGRSATCTISESGDYEADTTNGYVGDDRQTCAECDERTHDDDMNYSEHYEMSICDRCVSRSFTWAITDRRHSTSLVRDDDVIHIGNSAYLNDPSLLEECGFRLVNNEWYPEDDVIYLGYLGEDALIADCTRLDVDHGCDHYALTDDTITITLHGEELTVHHEYDGDTDETLRAARKQAARRTIRTYSRAPSRRRANRTLPRHKAAR